MAFGDYMALTNEIQATRKKVVTDGYEMSLGEIINLYKDGELKIDPIFQRLFRWEDERKTRFIESLILGIPVPPIFVYQDENGIWELIDGLQRLSTVLQLTGDLKGERAEQLGPLVLNGTRFLPSLNGMRWKESKPDANDGIGQPLQIEMKRARIRVEILKSDSDVTAKFELFQRLNTGGAGLSEQEVRNSMAVALNREFFDWLIARSTDAAFIRTTDQTENAIESQAGVELALRFIAFRKVPYVVGLDIHEYLDEALIKMATDQNFDFPGEAQVFTRTFRYLDDALGKMAFKRWNGSSFSGKFLISVFEIMAAGVAKNIEKIDLMKDQDRIKFLNQVARDLWTAPQFLESAGGGIRGTTRLSRLLPLSGEFLNPSAIVNV